MGVLPQYKNNLQLCSNNNSKKANTFTMRLTSNLLLHLKMKNKTSSGREVPRTDLCFKAKVRKVIHMTQITQTGTYRVCTHLLIPRVTRQMIRKQMKRHTPDHPHPAPRLLFHQGALTPPVLHLASQATRVHKNNNI